MGTKNDPGAFDCHAAAGDDEPLFTLLARDPLAPGLVEVWAMLRAGYVSMAQGRFRQLLQDACGTRAPNDDPDFHAREAAKVNEAAQCAANMRDWRRVNRP